MNILRLSVIAVGLLIFFATISGGSVAAEPPAPETPVVDCHSDAYEATTVLDARDKHECYSEGRFGLDLRQPRRPRHRSERANSSTIDLEYRLLKMLSGIDLDRSVRQFMANVMLSRPLAGHPLELLRPPSSVA